MKTKLLFQKWQEVGEFDPSTQKSHNLHFDWFLSCKAYNVWPEKSTEEVHFMTLRSHSKFEKKMPWGLKNDMRNLGNFHRRLEMSKLVFSWDLFIQSRKCMS